VELILELWYQLILCRHLLISELVLLLDLIDLHDVLIFDGEHDSGEYDNRGHEYVQQAEPHSQESEGSADEHIVHAQD